MTEGPLDGIDDQIRRLDERIAGQLAPTQTEKKSYARFI
jgi:hypothetical protein